MQGTRDRILEFIVQHRDARVEDLVDALGITSAAIRRHLDHLRADGFLDVRAVRQPTGRPYYAYQATELASGAMPPAYADLLERMLHSLGEREDVISGVVSSVFSATGTIPALIAPRKVAGKSTVSSSASATRSS